MTDAPDLSPPDEFVPIPALPGGHQPRFVSGDPDGDRIRIRYYRHPGDERVEARVWFGNGAEGPPSHAHGGSLIAVLDETMGAAAWYGGHTVVLARLTTNHRAMVPLHQVVSARAHVVAVDGRKVTVVGTIELDDGTVCVEADGLFISIGDRFEALRER